MPVDAEGICPVCPEIWPPLSAGGGYDTLTQTLAHEGRMPPIVN